MTQVTRKGFVDKNGQKVVIVPKVLGATSGNLASFNAEGNLQDSGKKPADFAPAAHAHSSIVDTYLHTDNGISVDNGGINISVDNGESGGEVDITADNIGNLYRALQDPVKSTDVSPTYSDDKLITAGAVYAALAEKMNVLKEVELRFDSQVGYYTMHANADDIIPFISAEDPQLVVVKCSIDTNANNIVHVSAIGSLFIYQTEQYDWEIELRVGETLFGRSFTARNTQEAEEAIDSMFDDYGAGAQVSKMNVTLFPSVS